MKVRAISSGQVIFRRFLDYLVFHIAWLSCRALWFNRNPPMILPDGC